MATSLPHTTSFAERIATREARIGIIGLGYAGLPLALAFAEAGFEVTGIDVSEHRVNAVEGGKSYLADLHSDRYAGVNGRLHASLDYAAVDELDALTICVPTPLSKTRTPDLSYVVSAVESVSEHLRPGQLIVLQSTTYPGTTEELVVPILQRSGRRVGEDLFVGYPPERVDPGNRRFTLRNTPKLVAGSDAAVPRADRDALPHRRRRRGPGPDDSGRGDGQAAREHVPRREHRTRERARPHVRPPGLSAWEVIDAGVDEALRVPPALPGAGPGRGLHPGRAAVPLLRMRQYGYSARLIDAAHEINAQMPIHVLRRVTDALNEHGRSVKGSRILLLGVAYKGDVHDTRESPSLEIMRQLACRGGDVRYCDPWVELLDLGNQVHETVDWCAEEVEAADCVVVLTPHRLFLDEPLWKHARLVVDTRNVVPDRPGVWRIEANARWPVRADPMISVWTSAVPS